MKMDLAGFQSAFAGALFEPGEGPHGPLAALTSQPAFAVYRNTVMKGCVDALEANFPSVARLVGSDWFRAAAVRYVAEQPPDDARLLRYGGGFADFLEGFVPARELPYLPGVARLDRCWTEVHAAADAAPDAAALLATLPPEALAATRITPHPAARWRWFADQPIFSIWSRNRTAAGNGDGDIPWQGEGALLTRCDGAVVWRAATQADCAFLDACAGGAPIAEAAQEALTVCPDVDLAQLLAGLLRADAIILASKANAGDMP